MPFTPPKVKAINFNDLAVSLRINQGSIFDELDDYDKPAVQHLEDILHTNPEASDASEALKLLSAYDFLAGIGFYKQLCILVDLYRKLPAWVQGPLEPSPAYTGGDASSPTLIAQLIKLRQDFLAQPQPDYDKFMRDWVEITNKINPLLKSTGYNFTPPDSKAWQRSNIDHVLSTKDPKQFNKKLVCLLKSGEPTAILSRMNSASLRKKERYSVVKNWLFIAKHIQAGHPRRAYELLCPMVEAQDELAIEVLVRLYADLKTSFLPTGMFEAMNRLINTSRITVAWSPSKRSYFKCMAQRIKVLQDIGFDECLICLEMKEKELKTRLCFKAAAVFGELVKELKGHKREFLQKSIAATAATADERVLKRDFLLKCQQCVEMARSKPIITEHRGLGDLIARFLNNVGYVLSLGQYNPRAPMVREDTYGFFRPKTHSLVVLERNPFPKTPQEVFWSNVDEELSVIRLSIKGY